jgi:hypothetical protein
MDNLVINEGIQGAKRQHTKEFDIRRFIGARIEKDPDLTLDEAIHESADHVLKALGVSRSAAKNMAPLLAFVDYGVSNHYHVLKKPTSDRLVRERRSAPLTQQEITKKVEEIRKNILLKTILPNGKSLFDSTREEIVSFRSDLTKLVEQLKPGQTPRQAGITSL